MIKIGIIKEGKTPPDHRVPLTPTQAKFVKEFFSEVNVVCQSSNIRCFSDSQYADQGIEIVDQLNDCDVILGVKEVQFNDLIDDKTYLFFSHTTKAQSYNRKLLQTVLEKRITLVDYEMLTEVAGPRIIAFGRWAGIVGAYNALYTYGQRCNSFDLKRAFECVNYKDLKTEYPKIKLPSIKIAITGDGRVSNGAVEVLTDAGIRKVSPIDYLEKNFKEPVFTQLSMGEYNYHFDGKDFDLNEFFQYPENFRSDFLKFTRVTDVLIAAAFWDPSAPVLFRVNDMMDDSFRIKVIADITCDIEGSIPSTKVPATIENPVYDFNPAGNKVCPPYSDESNVSVMAVDNLPGELPRDSSEDFGNQMIKNVIPHLVGDDSLEIIKRATITQKGKLSPGYSYLQSFVEGL
ncbi:MAG: NAD(P)-dependent oxidoreductase [Bacteroidetes bacterium]|nr:NAD(P)-dependent oxidoreductase [Bacteroidota bacterium]MDA1119293.1 NAD(P)-dependent oxidoreductase [Bacteroidota bacterium]